MGTDRDGEDTRHAFKCLKSHNGKTTNPNTVARQLTNMSAKPKLVRMRKANKLASTETLSVLYRQ